MASFSDGMVPPIVAGSRAAVGLNTAAGAPPAPTADTLSRALPSLPSPSFVGEASNSSAPPCSLERMLSASCSGRHRRRSASAVCTSSLHTGHKQPRQPPRAGGRWAARLHVWPQGRARPHGASLPRPAATAVSASTESAHAARQSPRCAGVCTVSRGGALVKPFPSGANGAPTPPSPQPAAPRPPCWGGVTSPAAGLSMLAPAKSSGSAGPKLPASAAYAITLRQSSDPAESISRLHAQKNPRRARERATQMRLSTEVKPSLPWALDRTRESRTRSFSSPW